jgi:hypothetical protein
MFTVGVATLVWSVVQTVLEAKGRCFRRSAWLYGPVALVAFGITAAVHGLTVAKGEPGAEATQSRGTRAVSVILVGLTLVAGLVLTAGITSIEIYRPLGEVAAENRGAYVQARLASRSHVAILAGVPILGSIIVAVLTFLRDPRASLVGDLKSSLSAMALLAIPVFAAAGYAFWHYPTFEAIVIEAMTAF